MGQKPFCSTVHTQVGVTVGAFFTFQIALATAALPPHKGGHQQGAPVHLEAVTPLVLLHCSDGKLANLASKVCVVQQSMLKCRPWHVGGREGC